jgi:hypothetical protein
MGKFPGNKVAQMNASILFRFKTLGKGTGIKIIHVLVNPDIGGHKCIQQQKIQIGEKVKALLGNIDVCIGGKPYPRVSSFKHYAAGKCRGVFYHEQRDCKAEHIKWLVGLNLSFIKGEKPEDFRTVIEDRGSGKYRWDLLNPVKLAKSDKMIIMPMSPDHSIDMRGTLQKKLLPEIR